DESNEVSNFGAVEATQLYESMLCPRIRVRPESSRSKIMKRFFLKNGIGTLPAGCSNKSSPETKARDLLDRVSSVHRACLVVGLSIMGTFLGACNTIVSEQNPPGAPDVFDTIRNVDLVPRFPREPRPNRRPPE